MPRKFARKTAPIEERGLSGPSVGGALLCFFLDFLRVKFLELLDEVVELGPVQQATLPEHQDSGKP